jgi:hypothetical protein
LPPSLRKLMLSSVESIQQLQGLTALESLELWSAESMAPEVLRQVSGLTNVTELRLGYFPKTPERIEEHAGVWPALQAVKGLDIQWHLFDEVLPARVIAQLPQCSALTRLSIEADIDSLIEGTSQQFVGAVSQLKQLQELRLAGAGFDFADDVVDDDDEIVDDMEIVLRGLLGLPQLQSLALVNVDLSFNGTGSDFRELRRMTQLTRLVLECPSNDSSMRNAIPHVEHLTGLRELRLAMHSWVGVIYAQTFASRLQQLQQIAYVMNDLTAGKWIWDDYGRSDVRVMHIEPDGCTTHVYGGEGAPQRHFPVPVPRDTVEAAFVEDYGVPSAMQAAGFAVM